MDFEETTESAREGRVKSLSGQLASDPSSLVFASLADMYREEGMLEEALAMCQAGLTIHPRHIPGQLILAKICQDGHRPLEALEALEKVLALEPGNPEARALLESLDAQADEPSAPGPPEGLPAGKPSGVVSEPQAAVKPLNRVEGFELIPEFHGTRSTGPSVAPPSTDEGLKIVPWGEAAAEQGFPKPSSEGRTPSFSPPEIERSTMGFVPGAIIQDSWVISRPIEMDYPEKSPSYIPPAPQASPGPSSTPPLTGERVFVSPFGEPVQPVSRKEPLGKGLEAPLPKQPPTLSSRLGEKPRAELPTISSLFASPPAPLEAPRVREEPEKPSEEVSLTEFMKSLSGTEFMKASQAPVAEGVAAEPEIPPAPSDEMRKEMEKALEDLLTLEEVEGAMIVNRDGLVLAERTRAWINAEEAAALAASIYETTWNSIGRMQMGQLDRGIVETALGQLYFLTLGETLLVLLTRDNAKMGLILMQVKKVMERVRRVVR